MNDREQAEPHKCENCPKMIHSRFKKCRECQKNDPYRGWYGVYQKEKGKRV